ncbi:MAG: hypothetical protein ACE5IQ_12185 [Candidatus Methylomirabilales bacterium]
MPKGHYIAFLVIVGLLISGCATTTGTGTAQTPPSHGGRSSVGLGVSGGTGGFGVSSGVAISPNQDPVANSAMMGAAIGALGGPIGLGVGALLGYFHGLNARKRMEKQARSEMLRQEQIDKMLEQQIEAKRQGGSSGIILLEDHLAPERSVAQTAPAGASSSSSGEGLIELTDHLTPPKPQSASVAAQQTPRPAPAGAVQAPGSATGLAVSKEEDEATRRLEAEIAAARERKRKLVAHLKSAPAGGDPARSAGSPAPPPLPAIDPEGFRPIYAGGTLIRKERDVNGDGKPDILRYYDGTGKLLRQEEDSRLTGHIDTRTFYEAGHPVRKESDTNGDGRVDLWAFYDAAGDLVRTEADTDHDGRRDRVIRYAKGEMEEEERYSADLDSPQMVITYAKGHPARKTEDTDKDGRIDRVTEYDGAGHVTKVSRNPSGDGTLTLFAYYQPETGDVLREEEDLNGDRRIDVISYYEGGRLVRREFFELPEVAALKPRLSIPHLPSNAEQQQP